MFWYLEVLLSEAVESLTIFLGTDVQGVGKLLILGEIIGIWAVAFWSFCEEL